MNLPIRIGMDTSKSVFRLHGVDENEVVIVRRQFRRAEMIRYFERLPPVLVAIESCGSSHHWARLLQSFGHEVKLIPPQYVKAYVKRGKNDAADAEALCEAVTRPSMRFVPVKSKERQAACMLMTVRERLVSVKSQLSNAFRSARGSELAGNGAGPLSPSGGRVCRGPSSPGKDRGQADEVASRR
jgi:transposase